MDQFNDYVQMGGYAAFVWPAYGLALVGLIGILWLSVKSWKAREDEFNRLKSSARDDGAAS